MQKQTVYIESSVISYLTAFPSRDLIVSANQQITYEWWQLSKQNFDCYISDVVIDEISLGDELAAKKRLEVVVDIDLLEVNKDIAALSAIYLNLFSIPKKSQLDALHLAIAV